jgi:hypothetical protein
VAECSIAARGGARDPARVALYFDERPRAVVGAAATAFALWAPRGDASGIARHRQAVND